MGKGERLESAFEALAREMQEEYGYSEEHLHRIISSGEKTVPATLFKTNLTPLEALTRYLDDYKPLKRPKAGLKKSRDNSILKHPSPLSPEESEYKIPVSVFGDKTLSPLEHVCQYLKERYGLKNSEIAEEIGKDPRTVWTVLDRAEKKRGDAS